MGAELVIPDQSCQLRLESSPPKHFNPDGSVDEDHGLSTRRLRTSLIFGAVPASARSLRPASLAMIDFRASRSSSALSVNPVYSCALFSRSSSSVTDALIASPLYTNNSTAMRCILVFQGLAIHFPSVLLFHVLCGWCAIRLSGRCRRLATAATQRRPAPLLRDGGGCICVRGSSAGHMGRHGLVAQIALDICSQFGRRWVKALAVSLQGFESDGIRIALPLPGECGQIGGAVLRGHCRLACQQGAAGCWAGVHPDRAGGAMLRRQRASSGRAVRRRLVTKTENTNRLQFAPGNPTGPQKVVAIDKGEN